MKKIAEQSSVFASKFSLVFYKITCFGGIRYWQIKLNNYI